MLKNILSVVAAFIGGGLCVFAVEKLGHMIYPVPAGLDMSTAEGVAQYLKTAPIGSLLFVLLAQSAGSLIGGFIAGRLALSKMPAVLVYAGLALIMAAINLILIPHPVWFMTASLLLPIPLVLAGARLAGAFTRPA